MMISKLRDYKMNGLVYTIEMQISTWPRSLNYLSEFIRSDTILVDNENNFRHKNTNMHASYYEI